FFFQAEDGIRAFHVTGVQTCALPISNTRSMFVSGWTIATRAGLAWLVVVGTLLLIGYATKVSELYSRRVLLLWFVGAPPLLMARSEERRVGKDGRWRS